MSLGGGATSEFCKADTRCRAGINIDGLQYGERQRENHNVPFLTMYSDEAPGVNDFLMSNSEILAQSSHSPDSTSSER
jgi:hypothetical protein